MNLLIQKHTSFYNSKITQDLTVYGLANRSERVEAEHRDVIRALKRMLVALSQQEPFWDALTDEIRQDPSKCYYFEGENVSGTSLAEAAVREGILISFSHDVF